MNERKQWIPVNARCVVCGKENPTDFTETSAGNFIYFHKECFKDELPKEIVQNIWRKL